MPLGVGEVGDLAVGDVHRLGETAAAQGLRLRKGRLEVVNTDVEGDVPLDAIAGGADSAADAALLGLDQSVGVAAGARDVAGLPAEQLGVEALQGLLVLAKDLEMHCWVAHRFSFLSQPQVPARSGS